MEKRENFARARTKEQVAGRREEIVNAGDVLFTRNGYEGVNFKAISAMTTFTRQSIYTYYQTKDEVLLDLLKREILNWQNEMIQKFDATQKMTKKQFCSFLTDTLVARYKMLDLFSILYTILEKNCSAEKLAEFKPDAIKAFGVISTGASKYFPHADIKQINSFTLAFFSYFLGLYPMAHITQKQIDALALAGIEHTAPDFRNMCYDGILHLLAWVD